ncbi:MAG TPA: sulfite oxidase [Thermoplasmata archaeon]|jgi:DMSO/TMAO reductase YedYZ molybdopterin-dependent catalytic subunit|nr:sulfite oxidase [Thermoplasmata archaeon]
MTATSPGRPARFDASGAPSPAPDVPRSLTVVTSEPLCAETPLVDLDAWITPTERFFVRSHFDVPKLDRDAWRLIVDGEVEHPLNLSFADLMRERSKTVVTTMECAGNSRSSVYPPAQGVRWRHGALGTARWTGISLWDVLAKADVRPAAIEAVFEGADHGHEAGVPEELTYAMSVPVVKAEHPDTLLAFEMNGEPLTPSHGFPVRVIVPGWYGMGSVKWVTRISLIDHSFRGYFRTRPYTFIHEGDDPNVLRKPVTSLQVKSVITWPGEGATVSTGRTIVRGAAWSGGTAISKVEVAIGLPSDSGGEAVWRPATILGPQTPHAWVRWEIPIDLDRPGYFVLRSRATDERGDTQPLRADWNFRGVANNSMHAVPLIVRRDPAAAGTAP